MPSKEGYSYHKFGFNRLREGQPKIQELGLEAQILNAGSVENSATEVVMSLVQPSMNEKQKQEVVRLVMKSSCKATFNKA